MFYIIINMLKVLSLIKQQNKTLISTQLKRLFIGAILAYVVYFVSINVDSVIGGMYFDEAGLSAITMMTSIYEVILFISVILCFGTAILHPYYIGKNDKKSAEKIFASGLIGSIVLGVVTAICILIFKKQILGIFNMSEEVYKYASSYYDSFFYIALTSPIIFYLYYCVDSDGNIKLIIIDDIAQMAVNLVLSIVLGKTSLGIQGLSLATFIASLVYGIIPIFHFFSKQNTFKLKFCFSIREVGKVLKMGAYGYIATLCISVLDIAINSFISFKFGDLYTTPYAIINLLMSCMSALVLIGNEMLVLMNISVGENNIEDIKEELKVTQRCSFFIAIGAIGIFAILNPLFPLIFNITTKEFILYCHLSVIVMIPSFLFTVKIHMLEQFYLARQKMSTALIGFIIAELIMPLIIPISLAMIFNSYIALIIGFSLCFPLSLLLIVIITKAKNKGQLYVFPTSEYEQSGFNFVCDQSKINDELSRFKEQFKDYDLGLSSKEKIESILKNTIINVSNINKKRKYGKIVVFKKENEIYMMLRYNGKIKNVFANDQFLSTVDSDYKYYVSATNNTLKIAISKNT